MGQLCSTPPKTTMKASVALSQEYKGVLFESINGDIIDAEAEAIINTANQQLLHNATLGNSLVAKGGQTIQEESNRIKQEYDGEVPIGKAVVTSGGALKAKHIIHVVIPVYNGGSNNEDAKLGESVTNALTEAEKQKVKSIAVPSFHGGVFGFPQEKAARIIVDNCVQYIDAHQPTSIQVIKFINTNAETVSYFKAAIQAALLKAGNLGESVHLARENVVEREAVTEGEKRAVRSSKPAEHEHPVEQRPEVVETVSEEKRAEVPVSEAAIEQVAEKTVEQAVEQAIEQIVEEKREEAPAVVEPVVEEKREEVPAVVEPVVEEQKPVEVVEEQKPVEEVVEEQKPVEVVEEQKPVEEVAEQSAAVEEQAAVVEEQAAAVEEQAAAVEEKPVEEVPAVVEEKQEEAPVAAEEKPVEEVPAVVEEKQEEAPAVVEEKATEEQPAVVEEQKTEEVPAADETKTEATNETQETKETEATEEGEAAAAEEAGEQGEQGGKKKNKKKKGKRN